MAITDTGETTSGANYTDLIPEIWHDQTRDSFLPNLIMANLVDRSFEERNKGKSFDTIHVHGMGDTSAVASRSGFTTASNISLGVGGTLASDVAILMAEVDIAINVHAYKFADLERELDMMTDFPLVERIADRTSYVVAQKVDADGATLVDDDGASQSVGALGTGLSDANIRRAALYLTDADVPEGMPSYVFVSANQQSEFFDIDKYANSLYKDALGGFSPKDGKNKGYFGSLYGKDFYMSTVVEGTNAAGHDNGMWGTEWAALVMIDNDRRADDYEITTDSHRHAVHSIYGWKVIRTNAITFMPGA